MSDRLPITHVAIRFQGRIWSLPKPYRHHHILRTIIWLSKEFGEYTGDKIDAVDTYDEDQGFLDEAGTYLNRKQALVNALLNGQVKDENKIRHNMLFSEDLW